MTWFTENSTPPVVLGTFLASVAAFLLIKTGHRAARWGLVAALAGVAVAVASNVLIVTPREQVTATLEEIRRRVEANDRAKLLEYIHPSAIRVRNQVQIDLSYLTVETAKINDLRVLVSDGGRGAKAEFIGVVYFANAGPAMPRHAALRFVVDLKKSDDDRWLVTGADYHDPLQKSGAGSNEADAPHFAAGRA